MLTTLGGDNNGRLGLIIDAAEYAPIPGIMVYVCPVQPTLTIPNAAMGPQIAALKETYYEALRLFYKLNAVERVIIQQLVSVIDAKYIQTLQNKMINKFTGKITTIFITFFQIMVTLPKLNYNSFAATLRI